MSANVKPNYREMSYFEIANQQYENLYKLNIATHKLNTKLNQMKAFVMALFLAFVAGSIGCGLAIHKINKEPITIQIQDRLVDIDKLPLPPLEEIK